MTDVDGSRDVDTTPAMSARVAFAAVHSYYGQDLPLVSRASIIEYLSIHAEVRANEHCITEDRQGVAGLSITYGELWRSVQALAQSMRSLGIGRGTYVGVLPANTIQSVLTILGVMASNGIPVVVSPHEPRLRIAEQLSSLGCSLVFAPEQFVEKMPGCHAIERSIADLPNSVTVELLKPGASDGALVMFTTGTTASSKAILLTHYNLLINAVALVRHHRIDPATRLLCSLPIHFANGLHFTVLTTLLAGAHVTLSEKFEPLSYLRLIAAHKINIASLVPSLLNAATQSRSVPDLYPLRYFVSAAAPLTRDIADRAFTRLGKRVIQGYGLTETTNFSTLLPTALTDGMYRRLVLDAANPSIGTEVFGNQVVVLSEDTSAPEDVEGEVCIRGHNVMSEYINEPAITAEAFRGGWFRTGDLGRMTTDPTTGERFFVITGRLKNMIKVGGEALSLDELDRVVISMPGVVDAVSFAIPDPYTGERPVLLVVPSSTELQTKDVLARLQQHFGEARLPQHVSFVAELPRSLNGKVNRRRLLEHWNAQQQLKSDSPS